MFAFLLRFRFHCLFCCWVCLSASAQSGQSHVWIGIASAPDHAEKRNAVRETWMQDPWIKTCTVRFVVGRSGSSRTDTAVLAEHDRHGDLLLIDVDEAYQTLVQKTELLLQAGDASGAQWIIKIDDDVMPRVRPLSETLHAAEKYGEGTLQYFGHFWKHSHPDRNSQHTKWYVPEDVFAGDTFPKYANGPLYVMSRSLAHQVVAEFHLRFLQGMPMVPLEDVSVGMMVGSLEAGKALTQTGRNVHQQVRYVDLELGSVEIGGMKKTVVDGCVPKVPSMYYHAIPPQEMRCMWRRVLQKSTDICCDAGPDCGGGGCSEAEEQLDTFMRLRKLRQKHGKDALGLRTD